MTRQKHLAAIFSDLHIHTYQQFNEDGRRLRNCTKVLMDIAQFCDSNNINTILFCGDLYDQQKALPTEVVNKTIEVFMDIFRDYPDITFYAITGNHDQSTKNLISRPAVSALTHIETISEGRFVLLDDASVGLGDGIVLSGIPYYEYPEDFKLRLEQVPLSSINSADNTIKYLMTHQTPRDISNKMIPFDTDPSDVLYKGYSHVFNGHIHARQQVSENYTVVGSPIHRDLADAGKPKGFLVANLARPDKGYKFFKLEGYPEFKEQYSDEGVSPEDKDNYVVVKPRLDTVKMSEGVKVEEFNNGLSSADLITNFWNEVGDGDEELLTVGLSFIDGNGQ